MIKKYRIRLSSIFLLKYLWHLTTSKFFHIKISCYASDSKSYQDFIGKIWVFFLLCFICDFRQISWQIIGNSRKKVSKTNYFLFCFILTLLHLYTCRGLWGKGRFVGVGGGRRTKERDDLKIQQQGLYIVYHHEFQCE